MCIILLFVTGMFSLSNFRRLLTKVWCYSECSSWCYFFQMYSCPISNINEIARGSHRHLLETGIIIFKLLIDRTSPRKRAEFFFWITRVWVCVQFGCAAHSNIHVCVLILINHSQQFLFQTNQFYTRTWWKCFKTCPDWHKIPRP